MKHATLFLTVLVLSGMTRAPEPLTGIECSVLAETENGVTSFVGRILADADTEGRYSLKVERKTAQISSSTSSGGGFAATAGQPLLVGGATHSGDLAGVTASMTLTVGDSSLVCLLAETTQA